MISRSRFLIAAAATATFFGAPLHAATQVTVTSPATGSTPGHTLLCDFNGGAGDNCDGRLAGGQVFPGDTPGQGVMGTGLGGFLVVGPNRGTAVISLADLGWRNISFDWGTIDSHNNVLITFVGGGVKALTTSIFGTPPVVPVNGRNSARVAVSTGQVIQSITFSATGVAGEFDNIAGSVPEPGTWMLMILGFGAVGFAMRRRQKTAVRFQFA